MGLDCVTFSELYLGPSVQFFELVLKVVGYDGVSVVWGLIWFNFRAIRLWLSL